MKQELSDVTVKALTQLMETASSVKAFTLEQAPDVLKQIVIMGRIEYSIYIGLSFLTIAILAIIGIYVKFISSEEYDEGFYIPFTMLSVVLGALSVGVICNVMHEFVCAWFAPKVFLIETVSHYIRYF